MTITAPVQNNQSNKIDDESRYQGGIENQQNSNYIRNNQDDIITDFENDRDSTIAGMSDEDFTLTNEDTAIGDTLSLNGEALGEYYRLINSEDYLRMLLAMINDTIDEATRIISSPYLPPPVHEEGNSGKKPTQVESAVKASKISGQYLGLFISTLFKRIMNHNQLLLEKRMKEIEKETTEWHDYLFGSCKNEAEWAAKQQKYAVRAFNDALKVSYSEMQKMMDKAGFPALDQNFSGKLEGKFDALSSDLFEDGKNGYIDENKLRNAVSELRLGFMNLINVQRLMLSAWDMKVRAKDLGFQVATGIKPGASMSDAVSQKFDFEASHLTNMFDIQSNNLITIGKLTNKEIYLQKQVEKANSWWAILTKVFSAFLAIVAIVLAIVALVLVCLGVTAPLGLILATCAVAVLGAVSKWLEVKLGDELIDDDMKFQDTKYEENIQTKKKKRN